MVDVIPYVVPVEEGPVVSTRVEGTSDVTTIVLVALLVDVAEEDPNVVGISVVVLASVVFATEGVKVLCSVVTGTVGTLVLCAVVLCSPGVD